jgi:hypothetical protein
MGIVRRGVVRESADYAERGKTAATAFAGAIRRRAVIQAATQKVTLALTCA